MPEQKAPDAPYSVGSLISEAGTGSNGDKLIDAVLGMYDPILRAAQQKSPNPKKSGELDMEVLEDLVASKHDVEIHDAVVRGGKTRADEGWVTFAGYDEKGLTIKGCLKLSDYSEGSLRSLIVQTDSLLEDEPRSEEDTKPKPKAKKQAAKKQAAPEADRAPTEPHPDYEPPQGQEPAPLDGDPVPGGREPDSEPEPEAEPDKGDKAASDKATESTSSEEPPVAPTDPAPDDPPAAGATPDKGKSPKSGGKQN